MSTKKRWVITVVVVAAIAVVVGTGLFVNASVNQNPFHDRIRAQRPNVNALLRHSRMPEGR